MLLVNFVCKFLNLLNAGDIDNFARELFFGYSSTNESFLGILQSCLRLVDEDYLHLMTFKGYESDFEANSSKGSASDDGYGSRFEVGWR